MRGWDPVACPGIGSDPDTDAEYDVVFLSTGLVESVAAAALAAVGKKVLQIEKTEHYGSSTWSTLELTAGGGRGEGDERGDRGAGDGEGTAPPPPFFVPVVSHASPVRPTPVLSHSPSTSSIHVDLNPRVAYADGPLISLLLASGAHNHTEFVFCKTVVWSDGAFVGVAASKGDVFKDESLTLSQKNSLMRALKGLAEEGTPWGKVRDPSARGSFYFTLKLLSGATHPSTQPPRARSHLCWTMRSSRAALCTARVWRTTAGRWIAWPARSWRPTGGLSGSTERPRRRVLSSIPNTAWESCARRSPDGLLSLGRCRCCGVTHASRSQEGNVRQSAGQKGDSFFTSMSGATTV